jgi:predicted acyl esterase
MGYVFRRGYRIRVQLAGAAHPRYARNPGTGDPLGTATRLRTVDYQVFGSSTLTLPARAPH